MIDSKYNIIIQVFFINIHLTIINLAWFGNLRMPQLAHIFLILCQNLGSWHNIFWYSKWPRYRMTSLRQGDGPIKWFHIFRVAQRMVNHVRRGSAEVICMLLVRFRLACGCGLTIIYYHMFLNRVAWLLYKQDLH